MPSDWTGGDGDWSDAAGWSPAAVPDAATAVLLDGSSAYTLTVSDAEAAASLALPDANATLSIAGTLSVAGTATLSQGVVSLSGVLSAASLSGLLYADGGTLSGGTVTGMLSLVSPAGPYAAFPPLGTLSTQGLALSAGSTLLVKDVDLRLLADGSIAAGTLVLGGPFDGSQILDLGGHILTLGADATVTMPDGGIIAGGTLVNDGALLAQHTSSNVGGTVSVGGSAFAQDGTLLATNQLVVVAATTFDNAGLIKIQDGTLSIAASTASNEGVISVGTFASVMATVPISGDGTLLLGPNTSATLADVSGTVQVASGGSGGLRLEDAPAFTGTLVGLASAGETLELAGLSSPVVSVAWSAGDMRVTQATGGFSIAAPDLSPAAVFTVTPDQAGDGYDVTVAANCFARGTRILSRRGPVPVEALEPGEAVWSPRLHAWRPVLWIGRRRLDCRCHPEPDLVRPVRIPAGSLGGGLPHADLVLSPEHCLFVPPSAGRPQGALVPARLLPAPRDPAGEVDYLHVELPGHDVLLAEGVPCESFLDDGARAGFGNGPAHLLRRPWLARRPLPEPCAPMALSGPAVEWLRARMGQGGTAHTPARGRRSPLHA